MNATQGSGTFAGIATLAAALRRLSVEVEMIVPAFRCPIYTLRRLWFNEQLRRMDWNECDLIVGFDMDGYTVAGRPGRAHVAAIKGVIADEMRFERGFTRLTMWLQALCEGRHVRRASMVMATSRYAARRLKELYGVPGSICVVPELIDLAGWKELFRRNPGEAEPGGFTVLTVCRFYPRKRLPVLLHASGILRERIPGLRVRIVGGGPEKSLLERLRRKLGLESVVSFLGDLPQQSLAKEYNACHLFCLPSVQEGFGIVFLEAMAADKPIVATRAAAIPEVIPQGELVEPDDAASLAEAIERLYRDPERRAALVTAGRDRVTCFDAPVVAKQFLGEVRRLL
jgi:glycosyltransferase involved in cell wall biosynthesis